MSEPTALELAAAQLAEAVQDYMDCVESRCVAPPQTEHLADLDEAFGAYVKAGGHVTVGGDWEP